MSFLRRFFVVFLTMWIPPSAFAEVLWDHWYTVSERDTPQSYYNEKAVISGDTVKIQVNTWIRAGKKMKTENIGATAKNTPLLEPLFYNYRTQSNGEEKVIDGTVDARGKVFSVKARIGLMQSKPLKAEMLPKLILASFFPVWIHKNYKKISGVQPKEFQAILEDQAEGEVPVFQGTAYEMRPDSFAEKTRTRKLRVEFNRVVAFWWVSPIGDAVRIEIPSLGKVVTQTTREKAEASLQP